MAEPPYRDDCCGDVPAPVARTCNAAISTKAARFAGGHLPLRIISPKPSDGVTPDRVTMQRGARTGMVLRSIIRFEGFAEDGT
jgi:hypothetical protein